MRLIQLTGQRERIGICRRAHLMPGLHLWRDSKRRQRELQRLLGPRETLYSPGIRHRFPAVWLGIVRTPLRHPPIRCQIGQELDRRGVGIHQDRERRGDPIKQPSEGQVEPGLHQRTTWRQDRHGGRSVTHSVLTSTEIAVQ
ncbi:hypothetical protein D3C78_1220280 [compost metagenome]